MSSARLAYSAYGLLIRSDYALWPWGDATSPDGAPEVTIELSSVRELRTELGFRPGRSEAVLDWPGVGRFEIRDGRTIRVEIADRATADELALVTGGPVLAMLLEQRGCVVLHGSCIQIGERAIAFLGASGAGKSTIAASLRERGYPLISDGMTVLDVSGPEPVALVGPPHLKLWPDAIQSLASVDVATRVVARQEQKRWYEVSFGLASGAAPLRDVFLLERGAAGTSVPLSPAAGLMGLVKNYFLAEYADGPAREFILRRCGRLGNSVAVSTLQRGDGLGELATVLARVTR